MELCAPHLISLSAQVKEPSALNESVRLFWETVSKPQPKEMLSASGFNFVDVRDVALAHIRGLDVPAAGGERFTLNKASFTFQQFCECLLLIHLVHPSI